MMMHRSPSSDPLENRLLEPRVIPALSPSKEYPDVETAFRLMGEANARRLGIYPIPSDLCLSIVVPIFNEESTLREIVERIQAVPIPKQIILVDDGSTDGTRAILAELESEDTIEVIYQDRNQGKGAAVRAGFERARGDIILIQDADLEYDPNQYLYLIQPVVEGRADVVYGSRFLFGGSLRFRRPKAWFSISLLCL